MQKKKRMNASSKVHTETKKKVVTSNRPCYLILFFYPKKKKSQPAPEIRCDKRDDDFPTKISF